MTGQHFRLGVDQLNANVPGSYEWVKQEEEWDDGSVPYIDDNGDLTVPSFTSGGPRLFSANTIAELARVGCAIFPLLRSKQQAANPLPKTSDVDMNSAYFHFALQTALSVLNRRVSK